MRIEKQLKMGFCLARRTKSGTKTTRLLILQQVRDGTNDNAEQSVLARLLLLVLVLVLLYYYFDADADDVSFSRLFVLSSLHFMRFDHPNEDVAHLRSAFGKLKPTVAQDRL